MRRNGVETHCGVVQKSPNLRRISADSRIFVGEFPVAYAGVTLLLLLVASPACWLLQSPQWSARARSPRGRLPRTRLRAGQVVAALRSRRGGDPGNTAAGEAGQKRAQPRSYACTPAVLPFFWRRSYLRVQSEVNALPPMRRQVRRASGWSENRARDDSISGESGLLFRLQPAERPRKKLD
jgi:hypothetical protein